MNLSKEMDEACSDNTIKIDEWSFRQALAAFQELLDNPDNSRSKTRAKIWMKTMRDWLPEELEKYKAGIKEGESQL